MTRMWMWLTFLIVVGSAPVLAREEAPEPEEKQVAEEPAEEPAAEAEEQDRGPGTRMSAEQAAEMAKLLRKRAEELRDEGNEERARMLEERASAIEEGRISPRMMQGRRGEGERRRPMREGMREGQREGQREGMREDMDEAVRDKMRDRVREQVREQRERAARERQEYVDKINRQAEEIEVLRERLEKTENELAAIKALLKRLVAE